MFSKICSSVERIFMLPVLCMPNIGQIPFKVKSNRNSRKVHEIPCAYIPMTRKESSLIGGAIGGADSKYHISFC